MKKTGTEIKKIELTPSFYHVHKEGKVESTFGLDNSKDLIDGSLGLYSTAGFTKKPFGPFKTDFYRIALTKQGGLNADLGLERFRTSAGTLVMSFPNQVFSLYNQSDDLFAYYLLFRKEFMDEALLMKGNKVPYPFFTYTGVQSFRLNAEEEQAVEELLLKMSDEIQQRKPDLTKTLQLYIQLILIQADRSYQRQQLAMQGTAVSDNALFTRFLKLISQHFLTMRKVGDYAKLLHVSSDHLNRTIKACSEKTAHELIEEMLLLEAKAYLKQSQFSVSEIAYQLGFTDPSHFNKFFKKLIGITPQQYRSKSE